MVLALLNGMKTETNNGLGYFAIKAMFASDELVILEAKLAKAMRRKQYEIADFLMSEHDKLALEAKEFDRIARTRLPN